MKYIKKLEQKFNSINLYNKYFFQFVLLIGTVAFLILCKIADSAMGIS